MRRTRCALRHSAEQQAFVGDHPFEESMLNPILTADLRQLGLKHAQLNVSGVWNG